MENNNLSLHTTMYEKDWSKLLGCLNVTNRLSKEPVFGKLAALYTSLLEKSVSPRQAVHCLYAQLSTLGLLLPVPMGLGWRTCFLLILCHALRSIYATPK